MEKDVPCTDIRFGKGSFWENSEQFNDIFQFATPRVCVCVCVCVRARSKVSFYWMNIQRPCNAL